MLAHAVELLEVTKQFDGGPAVLDRVSLSVAQGEFVAFIGPSGCGKSTLLRLVAGLTQPSAGRVLIDGIAPADAATRLGFVFQDATLLPWLNVAQNIELPQRLRGIGSDVSTRERRALLELVRLSDKAGVYPRQLSGGERMRVSIARALALRPAILLLDEPFAALDEMTRERLNEELLAIRERHRWTGFFVTHSVAEAVFLSTRVIVLSSRPGRIQAEAAIPLPYPRTGETRLAREYHDLVTTVSRLLRAANPSPP